MVRGLYRIYLYLVCAVLLGFAAFGVGNLLGILLLRTPLRRPDETAPDATMLVQAVVLAVVALLVAAGVGGLHYWLIRRDLAQEPGAAHGAVRTLALNLMQAVAALVALFSGYQAISQVGRQYGGGLASAVAAAVTALGVFALLERERRAARPARGGPATLERLHLYGVQTVVLLFGLSALSGALSDSVLSILAARGAIFNACDPWGYGPEGPPPAPPQGPGIFCDLPSALKGEYLGVAWMVAAGLLYVWLARGDLGSTLRQVAQYLGLVIGLIFALVGVQQGINLALRVALHATNDPALDLATGYDFVTWVVGGAIVVTGYVLWLAREAPATPLRRAGTQLTMLALAAIATGVPLYVGLWQALHDAVERLVAPAVALDPAGLAATGGLVVAGLAHPALAYVLRARTSPDAPIGPRRALVLAGLAAGALAAAIGGATALYLTITAALGSPTDTAWPAQARTATTAALVGAFLVGIHLWRLLGERKLIPAVPAAAPAPAAAPDAIEGVLDALLAGRLTRDEAATRLRARAGERR